jgi:hypothetical protein
MTVRHLRRVLMLARMALPGDIYLVVAPRPPAVGPIAIIPAGPPAPISDKDPAAVAESHPAAMKPAASGEALPMENRPAGEAPVEGESAATADAAYMAAKSSSAKTSIATAAKTAKTGIATAAEA